MTKTIIIITIIKLVIIFILIDLLRQWFHNLNRQIYFAHDILELVPRVPSLIK